MLALVAVESIGVWPALGSQSNSMCRIWASRTSPFINCSGGMLESINEVPLTTSCEKYTATKSLGRITGLSVSETARSEPLTPPWVQPESSAAASVNPMNPMNPMTAAMQPWPVRRGTFMGLSAKQAAEGPPRIGRRPADHEIHYLRMNRIFVGRFDMLLGNFRFDSQARQAVALDDRAELRARDRRHLRAVAVTIDAVERFDRAGGRLVRKSGAEQQFV